MCDSKKRVHIGEEVATLNRGIGSSKSLPTNPKTVLRTLGSFGSGIGGF